MKRLLAGVLAAIMMLSLFGCGNAQTASEFHSKVGESKALLDAVASAVLSNWYDAIYEDAFNDDINEAIDAALTEHTEDLQKIVEMDSEITELFKELKDDRVYGELCKDVMSAYQAYYDLVVKVSGSYNSFSEEHKQFEQDLTNALRNLSYEL